MSRPSLPRLLADVARRYQIQEVLPRCPDCREPCCELGTLVLELTWARLKGLWRLEGSRRDFDRRLARGDGPPEIRPQEGLYYAHGRPCPAYRNRRCSVYGTRLKPPGCGDFPVYEDEGALVADLRCEAVALPALQAELAKTLGPSWRVRAVKDPEFSFLVTLKPAPGPRGRGQRTRSGPPLSSQNQGRR